MFTQYAGALSIMVIFLFIENLFSAECDLSQRLERVSLVRSPIPIFLRATDGMILPVHKASLSYSHLMEAFLYEHDEGIFPIRQRSDSRNDHLVITVPHLTHDTLIMVINALDICAATHDNPLQRDQRLRSLLSGDTQFDSFMRLKKLLRATLFLDIPLLEDTLAQVIAERFPRSLEDCFTIDEHNSLMRSLLSQLHAIPMLKGITNHIVVRMFAGENQEYAAYKNRPIDLWPFELLSTLFFKVYRFCTLKRLQIAWQQHHEATAGIEYLSNLYSSSNYFDVGYLRDLTACFEKMHQLMVWRLIRTHLLQPQETAQSIHIPSYHESSLIIIDQWMRNRDNRRYLGLIRTFSINNSCLLSIPLFLAYIHNVQTIDLSYNALTFLPKEFFTFSALKTLILNNNHFTTLSKKIGNLREIDRLEVAHNSLVAIPETLGLLTHLATLKLQDNKLSMIPLSIALLNNSINELWLENNLFSDEEKRALQLLLPNAFISI